MKRLLRRFKKNLLSQLQNSSPSPSLAFCQHRKPPPHHLLGISPVLRPRSTVSNTTKLHPAFPDNNLHYPDAPNPRPTRLPFSHQSPQEGLQLEWCSPTTAAFSPDHFATPSSTMHPSIHPYIHLPIQSFFIQEFPPPSLQPHFIHETFIHTSFILSSSFSRRRSSALFPGPRSLIPSSGKQPHNTRQQAVIMQTKPMHKQRLCRGAPFPEFPTRYLLLLIRWWGAFSAPASSGFTLTA